MLLPELLPEYMIAVALNSYMSCLMQLYPVLNDLMQSMNKVSSTPVAMKVIPTPGALSLVQCQIKSLLEVPFPASAYTVDLPRRLRSYQETSQGK